MKSLGGRWEGVVFRGRCLVQGLCWRRWVSLKVGATGCRCLVGNALCLPCALCCYPDGRGGMLRAQCAAWWGVLFRSAPAVGAQVCMSVWPFIARPSYASVYESVDI